MRVRANWRSWLAFAHDVVAAAIAWVCLYWLRFNLEWHEPQISDVWRTLAWILPLQAGIFLAFGLYRGLWRFASLPDLQRIVLAAGLGAVAIPVVLVMLQLTSVVPRSVLILYPPVLIFLMAGSRFTYRIWKEHRLYSPVAELCAAARLEALTVPSYEDLISGRSQLTTIRHVELDDLLGRDPVVLDSAGLREWLGDRVILVTGAGGSIGAELCRQVARYRPARLILLELSEYALYQIQQGLEDEFPGLPVVTIVGDAKHATLVEQVLSREKPSAIFHAAAYKHVPLMEETNAWQAVRNNAYGTWVLARA